MADSALYCFKKIVSDSINYYTCMGQYYDYLKQTDSVLYNHESALKKLYEYYQSKKTIDNSYLVDNWIKLCSKIGLPNEWKTRQMNTLYQIITDNKIKDAEALAGVVKTFEMRGDKQIDTLYTLLNKLLFNNHYFDSSSAESWYYGAALVYKEWELSEQKTIQFLEKAVQLNPHVGDNKAMEL